MASPPGTPRPPSPRPGVGLVRRLGPTARRRADASLDRLRTVAWPILQAAIGVGVAYALAQRLLGHPRPFFAAVAVFVCLGLTEERRMRRVAELALGVTVGVLLGDVFVLVFGTGPIQLAVVLAAAVTVATLLGGRPLVVTQAGVQALLVVGLPPTAGGAFPRWQDAVVGSAVAIAVAAGLPGDPVRAPRRRLRTVALDLAGVLDDLAAALRAADPAAAGAALDAARDTGGDLDALAGAIRGGTEVARIAPLWRRRRAVVADLAFAARHLDLAVRNARVVARRGVRASEAAGPLPATADVLAMLGAAASALADGPGEGFAQARERLARCAAMLDGDAGDGDLGPVPAYHAAAVLQLVRPLAVDLLQATGLEHTAARRHLP